MRSTVYLVYLLSLISVELLKFMNKTTRFYSALWASSTFLRQVSGKISNISKMKVSTTKYAVGVSRHHILCSAKELAEGLSCRKVLGFLMFHVPFSSGFTRGRLVVVATNMNLFGEGRTQINGKVLPSEKD